MSEIYWIILWYFGIGLGFLEAIKWVQNKWRVTPMGRPATILVLSAWPAIILLALMLVWRKKT